MSFPEFFGRLVAILAEARVEYMVVGSVASATYGESRTTRDIDVVVDLDLAGAARLVSAFPKETWYADLDAAREAVYRRRMFNVIDESTFWKVDFVVRSDGPYDHAAFARRRQRTLAGQTAWIASAEDVVLGKLRWAAASGSERQLDDVAGIVRVQVEALDRAYVERWVGPLGVEGLWRRALARG